MFCAGWTVLVVLFHFVARIYLEDRAFLGYIRFAIEAIAVLSWLAGFIAVAVQISTDACPSGKKSCGPLVAATVLGGVEFLLFVITAAMTVIVAFYTSRNSRALPTKTSTDI